eukprot:3392719-Alexandrium_andersonii.AAC.1
MVPTNVHDARRRLRGINDLGGGDRGGQTATSSVCTSVQTRSQAAVVGRVVEDGGAHLRSGR